VAARAPGAAPDTIGDVAATDALDAPRRAAPLEAWERWALPAIVLLGVLVRFPTLGQQSFWLDEAYTHQIVAGSLGHVIATVPRTESTPPVYYVLAWLWSRLFGTSEAGLRSLSALCGTLTIPVLHALGRRIASHRVGLIAALLAAANPLLFWYGQEARAYALLVLLSALTLLLLLRARESPTPGRLAAWGALAALALATHYFAAVLVVPEAVWLLAQLHREHRLDPRRAAAALAIPLAVGLALLPLLIHQDDGRASFLSSESGSLATRLAQLVKQDIVAYDEPAKVALTAVGVLLVLAALALLATRGDRGERRAVALPAGLGLTGVILAVLVALAGKDLIDSRNLLETWPAFALPVAVALGTARATRAGAGLLAALVVLSLVCVGGVIADPLFQRADWRGAARALGAPGALRAIVTPGQGTMALRPYLARLRFWPGGAVTLDEVDVIGLDYRPPGARTNVTPPRPSPPPRLPGFTLVSHRETESYTALRYRAAAPRAETAPALLALALAGGEYTVMLQAP
jgi:mannosyltransferase